MIKPHFFKFRQACSNKFNGTKRHWHDSNLDVVKDSPLNTNIPAIMKKTTYPLGTNKADLEKGEDEGLSPIRK